MGNIWAGMAPTVKNHQIYTDFILMQTKVLHVRRKCFSIKSSDDHLDDVLYSIFVESPYGSSTARK